MGLVEKKEDCCGCKSCENICPVSAITMKEDEYGFEYPEINASKCIHCNLCETHCPICTETFFHMPQKVYAASYRQNDKLIKSSSGGIFSAAAEKWIETGGIVFGSAFVVEKDKLTVKHIMASSMEDLEEIRGSKYVQSDMGRVYQEIRKLLNDGKKILFSGTPCQVDALNKYLGDSLNKSNLVTIGIICHGVPNRRLFWAFISELEKDVHSKIVSFSFRYKKIGWQQLLGYAGYRNGHNRYREKLISPNQNAYYRFFLDGETYRESCYHCKYAGKKRCEDITIGDYWGVEKQHPEFLERNGGNLDEQKGISCVLINTYRGQKLLELIQDSLNIQESTIAKVAESNEQLVRPSKIGKNRDTILELFRSKGYLAVQNEYLKSCGLKGIFYKIFNRMPGWLQLIIRKKV